MNLDELKLKNIGIDKVIFGKVFTFVDYGNVNYWYENDERDVDGNILNTRQKLIIDIEQDYKTDASVLSEMNPSKTIGPIVLVDPTYKERNAVSGLSLETLTRFAKVCKAFIAKPSIDFFEVQDVALDFKASDIVLLVHSDKQAGDIAGTKSKKFFRFFLRKLAREFVVKKNGFSYDEEANEGRFYIRVGKKKDEVITGSVKEPLS